MSEALRILVVEDNPADADFIHEMLPETGAMSFQVESVSRLSQALTRLESKGIDLVLLDLGLPDSQGLQTLHKLRKAAPDVPVIVLTGTDDQELAFTAVRHGAQDYLVKGQFNRGLLTRAVRYALERQKAAAELQCNHEQYRRAIAAANAIPYQKVYGADTYAFMGEGIKELTGYAPDELRSSVWKEIILETVFLGEAAGLPLAEAVRRTLAGEIKHWRADYRIRTRSGAIRWISDCSVQLLDADGKFSGSMGIIQDITQRKELETQLRQAQKMEAVGQLAGGVAHDFNNMLAVIQGNAELLLLDEGQLTAKSKQGLEHVVEATERAANLTRQLLAFSRKQVMQPQPLVLNKVIANLTKMLNRVLRENIDLQCHYAVPLPYVQADPGMMEQVILNLVVNARDAMPEGGQLRVATEPLTLDEAHARVNPEARAGEFVCMSVSDTGTGIAPEVLPRIFEPFFTTKGIGKGTGLGLATVYGIVQQHEGWLEVSSQAGEGTTFKVFLPAIPTPARLAPAVAAEVEVHGGKETILLVEDEHSVRLTTRRVLESQGYTILEATTAREALEVWQTHEREIALLLTDIVMPGEMTGRDLADQLWGQRPGLKVVFMSGYSAEVLGTNTEFIRRTRSYFLQKPSTSQAILETVRQCLDQKEPVAAPGKAGGAK
jgi:PAS domain S-box-containing protein